MRLNKGLYYILSFVLIVAFWKILSVTMNSPVLPAPEETFANFVRTIDESMFWLHFRESAIRVTVSILISLGIAFPLSIALGYNEKLDKLLSPILYLSYPVPKIVFLPVIFVLFGLGNVSRILLISVIVTYQIVVIMKDGVSQINRQYVEVLRSMGSSHYQIIRHVLIPGALPSCFTALRLSTGTAITVLFLVETYATDQGLGYYIIQAWGRAAYGDLFVGIIGMSLLGILFYALFSYLEKNICRWKKLESAKEDRPEEQAPVITPPTPGSTGRLKKLRAWYWAGRPFTLTAAVAPVLVGSALALSEGTFKPLMFFMVLIASLLVQITANLVDEYSDHSQPGGESKILAPYKVIALGALSAKAVKRGAIVTSSVAALIGVYIVLASGWPIFVICLLSLLAAYLYAGGPHPLGKLGLGHPLVFVFMGPVMVMGSYYVQTGAFTVNSLIISLSVACSVTAILAANDLRDLEEDKIAGKTTFVTLGGRLLGRWEWTMLLVVAFGVPFVLLALGFNPLVLLPLLALPLGFKALKAVWQGRERKDFQLALQLSSSVHGYLGLLLAAGVAASYFVLN